MQVMARGMEADATMNNHGDNNNDGGGDVTLSAFGTTAEHSMPIGQGMANFPLHF